jgi:Flp pilus assembly secretin CpaC
VLGALFDTENSTRSKTDLYIVVTPHVVRGRVPPGMAAPPAAAAQGEKP